MKRLHSFFLLMTVFSLFLFSCKKNIDTITPPAPGNTFTIPVSTPVNGSVAGRVTDENNVAVSGANISCGGLMAVTDDNGVFNIDNVNLDKYVSTVTVTKTGYYKGIRSFSANSTKNYVDIKLIPKTLSGTFASASTGTITLSNSTEIKFQSNSIIVKSTGAPYTGAVNVYASYIDPTRADIGTIVPGSFMARDANNMYVLQSAGMIAVDLESNSGEALQLVTSKPASIKLPIPASLISSAPATIDTWSLDDNGIWKKEGTATKAGNNYEMEVSHFSFWNCDVPANAVYLTLHVEDQNAVSLRNTLVKLSIPNNTTWWANTYGRTDSAGNVSGLVPAGLPLVLNILPGYNCASAFTQNIGPFTTNTSLTITATLAPQQTYTVTGTATSCNGALDSATAFISLNNGGYAYTNVVNGSYSYTFTSCNTPSSVYVSIRKGNLFNSTTVAASSNNIVVPSLQVCQPTSTTAVFTCQSVSLSGTYTQGVATNSSNRIILGVNVTQPGIYTITTNSANGVRFSASGNLPVAGSALIDLIAVGTPLNAGPFQYNTQIAGVNGCGTTVTYLTGTSTGSAIFSIGCNLVPTGQMIAGIPTNGNVTVTTPVTVTTAGSWSISSNFANGVSFMDSGFFQAPGVYNINVEAYGTPSSPGTFTYTFTGSSASPNSCIISITTQVSSAANYTFAGAPDSCQNFFYTGSYNVGTPMNSQNTVTLNVNVTNVGTYTITSTTIDGITFSRTGTFTQTGLQPVTLNATGTPVQAGLSAFNFIGNIQGCSFIIPVN